MNEIISGVGMFTGIVLALVAIILAARSKLVASGNVRILINNDESKAISVPAGGKLLNVLADNKVFVSSACGGGGTCAQCKVHVHEGGGDILPTETGHINKREAREGMRLSCQVNVKQDMNIAVPPDVFSVKKWECEVVSNDNVATFIKEFVVRLPPGETLDFESGGFIQIEVPPFECDFKDFEGIDERFHPDWDRFKVWDFKAVNTETIVRAYSMGNHPAEGDIIMLNIRIAVPPPDRSSPTGWKQVPPGLATSYIFSRKPGDKVTISGAFGEFFIQETEREMVYIGGGAGMAPLRSHLFHLFHTLKTGRKVSYWYGARNPNEVFYEDLFRQIEEKFPNFEFHIAMSDPRPEDNWDGYVGFIHQVLNDNYLAQHQAPEDVEYYICGPPIMLQAVQGMLDSLGVEEEMIRYDDFGS
ncbi:MAG: NADH:ubiquinone reductase (Na(+)-transporting) subunit F [Gemmatimonadetes bacterium]|jgi:Na+-transporting NADH:ubiquinone oxidoreductase subunit F|nr:NADH:ubiquinone reductase (Na(+)-transporting) subunit F [Gemmatimonadota bacterium]MBT5325314.1 NADH:ubiquinone reductase (Na(+)-transporting) subunit F [Gemmatimonadota bacterium]MBT5801614.1 NADH:ubiquinone reductase (Na(+)-transporting) subunit F [Gemmatimonadota bacterium]MBT6903157.1 NADH:ubiquinone reductase (Na(+)-transporting) subunit F [Gemmatimonadota bacterium]MBT7421807.1 NADH:ubiquinone reductase (Na(+)-transporting) subunit F [Gemmatimonadota bacterium]